MSLLFKSMPKPMVKIEDDDDVIIDLECTEVPQSKGPVNRWHQHVLFMLKKCWMTMSEMHFDDFIKFYRRSLTENCLTSSYQNNDILIREKMVLHLNDIDNFFEESRRCYIQLPTYFINLEDILSDYVSLELKIVSNVRKREMAHSDYLVITKKTSLKICKALSTYMKDKEEHIMHTLLKISYEKKSVCCREIMTNVYLHFLVQLPVEEISDLAFCRNYLVLQCWKEDVHRNEHEVMNKLLAKRFKQNVDYIHRNEILKSIITKPKTVNNFYHQVMDSKSYDKQGYFLYVKKKREEENETNNVALESLSCITIDDDDDDPRKESRFSFLSGSSRNNYLPSNYSMSRNVLFEEEDNRCRPNNIFTVDLTPGEDTILSDDSSNVLPNLIYILDDDEDSDIVEMISNEVPKLPSRPIMECIDLVEENSNDQPDEVPTSSTQCDLVASTSTTTAAEKENEPTTVVEDLEELPVIAEEVEPVTLADKEQTKEDKQDSRKVDAEIQTDPTIPILDMYDTPPSDQQFDEKCENNVYLETAKIVTSNVEETYKRRRNTSEISDFSELDYPGDSAAVDEVPQLNTSIDIANDSIERELFGTDVDSNSVEDGYEPNIVDAFGDSVPEVEAEETVESTQVAEEELVQSPIIVKVETISDAKFHENKSDEGSFCKEAVLEDQMEYVNDLEYEEVVETCTVEHSEDDYVEKNDVYNFVTESFQACAANESSDTASEARLQPQDEVTRVVAEENVPETSTVLVVPTEEENAILRPEVAENSPAEVSSSISDHSVPVSDKRPKQPGPNGIKLVANQEASVITKVPLPDRVENLVTTTTSDDNVLPQKEVVKSNIMYSSSSSKVRTIHECDFNRFQRNFSDYATEDDNCVSETFNEVFSGPVTKLNGSIPNHDDNFDFFDSIQAEGALWSQKTPEVGSPKNGNATEGSQAPVDSTPPVDSPPETDTSPTYQDVDISEFKSYLIQFQNSSKHIDSFKVANGAVADSSRNTAPTAPKAPKRVAVMENNNVCFEDDGTFLRDLDLSKRIRQTPKPIIKNCNGESYRIQQLRRRDSKLQQQPIVLMEKFSYEQLQEKFEREVELAMLERSLYARKHNTMKSCIQLRINYDKDADDYETDTSQSSSSRLHDLGTTTWNNLAGSSSNHRKWSKPRGRKPGKRKAATTYTGKKRGRRPKKTENLSKEFEKLLSSPSYTQCTFKGSSQVQM